jgi:hypothetical protein
VAVDRPAPDARVSEKRVEKGLTVADNFTHMTGQKRAIIIEQI